MTRVFACVSALCLLSLAAVSACSDKAAAPPENPSQQASPTPALQAEVASCNLETQLKPGVPGSPGNFMPSDTNPNGVSELAAHMIAMRDDLARVRTELLAGGTPRTGPDHYRIRCAWPTTQADRNPSFDAMSANYLSTVDAFNTAAAPTPDMFNTMVQSCLACHAQTCSGASVAIKPLLIQQPGKPKLVTPPSMFE